MFSLSQGGKGNVAGLSLPQLCSVSSTREERLLVQELKQLGQRNGSDYKLCRTDAGRWGHTKTAPCTPPSTKMLLEELKHNIL